MRGKLLGRLPTQRILVTGAPRSATTFVGRVLSWPRAVDYLHEPFNPDCGLPSIRRRHVDLAAAEEPLRSSLDRELHDLLQYRPMLRTGHFIRDPWHRRVIKPIVGSRGPFKLRQARLNPFTRSVVMKDPFAVMSLESLIVDWGFEAVCLVRHPLAFVASFQRLGWTPTGDLADLAAQADLLARLHDDDRARLAEPPGDETQAAALLWRILARELVRVVDRTGAPLVTHEEVSREPVSVFRSLYGRFGLDWTPGIERRLRRETDSSNAAEAGRGKTQDFTRDSRSLLAHRLASLDDAERSAIWDVVGDVATPWYTPDGTTAPS